MKEKASHGLEDIFRRDVSDRELYQCSPLYQDPAHLPTGQHQSRSPSPAEHQATTSPKTPRALQSEPREPCSAYQQVITSPRDLLGPRLTSQQASTTFSPLASYPGVQPPGGGHGNPFQYNCLENPYRQKNLEGHSTWLCKESDRTEHLSTSHHATRGDVLPALQVKTMRSDDLS